MSDLLAVPAAQWVAMLLIVMAVAAGVGLIESRRRRKAKE
jgi:hypothetical protein